MGKMTDGATAAHVEMYVLRALKLRDWKESGEIKDYVERNAPVPIEAKRSLPGRPAERQTRNAVQNVLRPTTKSSLTGRGFLQYDQVRGCYRITPEGIRELAEMEFRSAALDELMKDL